MCRGVTAVDIQAFAQKYLVPGNRTVVPLLPEAKER
jgi:predicted Zn-dependent peptidase